MVQHSFKLLKYCFMVVVLLFSRDLTWYLIVFTLVNRVELLDSSIFGSRSCIILYFFFVILLHGRWLRSLVMPYGSLVWYHRKNNKTYPPHVMITVTTVGVALVWTRLNKAINMLSPPGKSRSVQCPSHDPGQQ